MIYKEIKNYPNYEISENGDVRNIKTGRFLKKTLRDDGFLIIPLSQNNVSKIFYVNRLVATAFIPNPSNFKFVIHIDGNKENNNVNNLQWVCVFDFAKKVHSILSDSDRKKISALLKDNVPLQNIANLFNVSYQVIYHIKNNN